MNLQNLIDYCKVYELPDPLSGISVPEPIDADRVRAAIMMRCGLLTPIYNDPATFTNMLAEWFAVRKWNFEHLINIVRAEYSPIENTNKYSDHTTSRNGDETITHGGSDIRRDGGTDSVQASGSDELSTSGADTLRLSGSDTTTETPNTTETRTDEISAENVSTYQPDAQHTTTETGNTETETEYGRTDTTTYGKKDTTTYGKKDITTYGKTESVEYGKTENRNSDGSETYTEHTHGNIGVTTNQQMINEELELIKRFNLYDWIAGRIEDDLFIVVY